jgi:two-component system sensor histidine kinase UhpB
MLQVDGLAAAIPDELREQLGELRENARLGTEEVRRIARRLRPDAVEDMGLQSALAALARHIAEGAHIRIGRHPDGRQTLTEPQELVVYEWRRKRSQTWCGMPRQSTCNSASTTGGDMPC